MNLEPENTSLSDWHTLFKGEQTSVNISTKMIQVRWDWVGSTSKINIVREVESIFLKIFSNFKFEEHVTSEGVQVSIVSLNLFNSTFPLLFNFWIIGFWFFWK